MKTAAAILAAIGFALVLYLCGAFVAMDWNPANWDAFGRLALAAVFVCFVTLVADLAAHATTKPPARSGADNASPKPDEGAK